MSIQEYISKWYCGPLAECEDEDEHRCSFSHCNHCGNCPEEIKEKKKDLENIVKQIRQEERERILSELPDYIVATSEGAKYREGYNDCLEEIKNIISK